MNTVNDLKGTIKRKVNIVHKEEEKDAIHKLRAINTSKMNILHEDEYENQCVDEEIKVWRK